jgi:hypothetical protein
VSFTIEIGFWRSGPWVLAARSEGTSFLKAREKAWEYRILLPNVWCRLIRDGDVETATCMNPPLRVRYTGEGPPKPRAKMTVEDYLTVFRFFYGANYAGL